MGSMETSLVETSLGGCLSLGRLGTLSDRATPVSRSLQTRPDSLGAHGSGFRRGTSGSPGRASLCLTPGPPRPTSSHSTATNGPPAASLSRSGGRTARSRWRPQECSQRSAPTSTACFRATSSPRAPSLCTPLTAGEPTMSLKPQQQHPCHRRRHHTCGAGRRVLCRDTASENGVLMAMRRQTENKKDLVPERPTREHAQDQRRWVDRGNHMATPKEWASEWCGSTTMGPLSPQPTSPRATASAGPCRRWWGSREDRRWWSLQPPRRLHARWPSPPRCCCKEVRGTRSCTPRQSCSPPGRNDGRTLPNRDRPHGRS
eukprot:m.170616 g.170616  ORF g.170616 m.170616 type:complete len:316 (-) comp14798_c0_seq1:5113-6060(-)